MSVQIGFDAARDPDRILATDSHRLRYLISLSEADPVDFVDQPVRILLDQLYRVSAVIQVEPQRLCRRKAKLAELQRNFSKFSVCRIRFSYLNSFFTADPIDLSQPVRIRLYDFEGLIPEFIYDRRGSLGADAFDRAGCEKLTDPHSCSRYRFFCMRKRELLSISRMDAEFASEKIRCARLRVWKPAYDRDQLILCLHLGYGVAVLFVIKEYLCECTCDLLHFSYACPKGSSSSKSSATVSGSYSSFFSGYSGL